MTKGVELWSMLATPFEAGGDRVDHDSLRRYAQTMVSRGSDAAVALGVIGEPATLSASEQVDVVATILDSVEVPVYASMMSLDPRERQQHGSAFADMFGERLAGLLVPVDTADPISLRRGLEQTHRRCGELSILVQDYPASSGVAIAVDDLAQALDGLPFIAAIKCEAPPTFARIRRLRQLLPSVRLVSGLGGLSLLDDVSQGASAAACGITRPEVVALALSRLSDGHPAEARRLVSSIGSFIGFEVQAGTSVAIRKQNLWRQGVIDHPDVRRPTAPYESWLDPLLDAYDDLVKDEALHHRWKYEHPQQD